MSDGHVLADKDAVLLLHTVQHAAILHVGMRAQADGMDVAAKDGVHPDAGIFAEHDVADQLRRLIDKTRLRHRRRNALVGANHVVDGL